MILHKIWYGVIKLKYKRQTGVLLYASSIYLFICCLTLSAIFTGCSANTKATYDLIHSSIADSQLLKTTNIDSCGAKVECKPTYLPKSKNDDKAKLASIQLVTSGFLPGKKYALYIVNSQFEKTFLGMWIANTSGQLVYELDEFALSNYKIHLGKFLNGEQVYCALIAEDNLSCLVAAFSPMPIEYEWRKWAYITALSEDFDRREREAEEAAGRGDARQRHAEGSQFKKMVTPAAKRQAVAHLCSSFRGQPAAGV